MIVFLEEYLPWYLLFFFNKTRNWPEVRKLLRRKAAFYFFVVQISGIISFFSHLQEDNKCLVTRKEFRLSGFVWNYLWCMSFQGCRILAELFWIRERERDIFGRSDQDIRSTLLIHFLTKAKVSPWDTLTNMITLSEQHNLYSSHTYAQKYAQRKQEKKNNSTNIQRQWQLPQSQAKKHTSSCRRKRPLRSQLQLQQQQQ